MFWSYSWHLSTAFYTTRHWQTSGQLLQKLNICTVQLSPGDHQILQLWRKDTEGRLSHFIIFTLLKVSKISIKAYPSEEKFILPKVSQKKLNCDPSNIVYSQSYACYHFHHHILSESLYISNSEDGKDQYYYVDKIKCSLCSCRFHYETGNESHLFTPNTKYTLFYCIFSH